MWNWSVQTIWESQKVLEKHETELEKTENPEKRDPSSILSCLLALSAAFSP